MPHASKAQHGVNTANMTDNSSNVHETSLEKVHLASHTYSHALPYTCPNTTEAGHICCYLQHGSIGTSNAFCWAFGCARAGILCCMSAQNMTPQHDKQRPLYVQRKSWPTQ
jgi:hypothetical protein